MKINGDVTLNQLGLSTIKNLVVERLATVPVLNAAEKGRLIYNTTDNTFYLNNGAAWVTMSTSTQTNALVTEVDNIEAALGFILPNGTIDALPLQNLNNVGPTATTLLQALQELDSAISGQNNLSTLADVNALGIADKKFLRYDGATSKWVMYTPVLADISNVTASATEVNYLTGLTGSVQTQINTEASTRTTNDATLQSNIDAEATRAGNAEAAIQAELNTTQIGAGLNATGTYKTRTTSNYLNSAMDLHNADTILDTQLKSLSDSFTSYQSAQATYNSNQDTAIAAKLPLAGGTMSGNVTMPTGTKITITDMPVLGTDATNKAYVDSAATGLYWKTPVDGVVDNVALVVPYAPGGRAISLLDGKIYTSDGLAWDAGATPADAWSVFNKADESGWVYSGTVWVQFSGAGQIVDGIGLVKTGNVIDVNLGAGIAELPTDQIGIDVLPAGGLLTTTDGVNTSTATNAQLAIRLDATDATYGYTLTLSTAGIRVAQGIITSINQNTADITAEITNRQSADTNIQTEVDMTQSGAGLETTGAYTAQVGANYISAATSLKHADTLLDAALKAEETARLSDVNGIDTALTTETTNRTNADTAINNRIANGYFQYTNLTAATSHIVTHNIGSRYCNVTVIDSTTNEQVIPQSVVFDTVNQLTVTFNTAVACHVVVMGLAPLV